MKRILTLFAFAMTLLPMNAQEECSTMWPYLYKEFQQGTIYKKGGEKFVQQVNIHTLKGRLHFIDEGKIKEVTSSDVLLLQIGEDKYMNVDGDIMKVVANNDKGFIAAYVIGDFEKLNDTGGAYGTSTTNSATMKLSSVQVAGHIGQNHMEMRENRSNGELVPLITTYYVVTPDLTCKASKRDLEMALTPERKASFKIWLKSNKIKWNDPESLLALVEFINN